MSTPFGPRLIGQTEKTLTALLMRILDGRLTEPEWVSLRLADQLGEGVDGDDALATEVARRAHFAEAPALVAGLAAAGFVRDGRLTDAGRALLTELQGRVDRATESIWRDLPEADVAATERVLNEVGSRARAALG